MHWVRDLAWSPDDTQIASVSDDKSIKIWDAESGQLVKNYNGHEGVIYGVIWANDLKKSWPIKISLCLIISYVLFILIRFIMFLYLMN